jgi:glycosyltransferase involved in cell wall biosynthesis
VGLAPVPFRQFENGANVELFATARPALARQRLMVSESALLTGFLGADNPQYDFAAMLAGVREAHRSGLEAFFLCAGGTALQRRIRALARQLDMESLIGLYPRVAHADVPPLLRALDAGFVLWQPELDHMAPTALKLKELLLSGVPVVCDVPPCWRDWPLAAAVWQVADHRPESIAGALFDIARDRRRARARAASGGEQVRSDYGWDRVAERYGRALEEWCELGSACA